MANPLSQLNTENPSLCPAKSILPADQNIQRDFCIEDFDVGKKIGSGKFGRVFEAIYKPYEVRVALKVVYKQMLEQFKFHG